MKKRLLMVMAFALLFCVAFAFSNTVSAANDTYATVADITNTNTLHDAGSAQSSNIVGQETADVTITYNSASLKMLDAGSPADGSEGRPEGYAWLGIRLTAPSNAVKYKVEGSEDATSITGGTGTVDEYFGVNYEKLENAAKTNSDIVYTYKITWYKGTGDEELSTQTVKVVIKAKSIVLYDKNNTDDDKLWDEATYTEVYEKAKAEAEASSKPTPKPIEDSKDKTPQTGVLDLDLYIALTVGVVSLVGFTVVKKSLNENK